MDTHSATIYGIPKSGDPFDAEFLENTVAIEYGI